jgi:hypothetical protein
VENQDEQVKEVEVENQEEICLQVSDWKICSMGA